jgi:ABC-type lipoprotein release transport system permease subunit
MDIKDTIKLFPAASSARTELLVDSRDLDSIDEVLDSLSEKLGNPYRFSTWDVYNRSVYENFITSRQVILMVFLMIILVASVYVSSITGEIIQDDRQSIATLKAMGAGNPLIRRAYFHVSLSITVFGVAIGTGIGLLFGTRLSELMTFLSNSGLPGLQYYLLDFPLTVSWGDIGLVAFSMMVLSSITVLFALKRIGKISPLELLQQS